jgi:glutamyl-tRNA reductase
MTGDDGIDRAAVADRVRDRAEAIRRREQAAALRKLSARGEVTERQRVAVAEMAAGIVDGLLSTPESALREADEDALRSAVEIYGLDPAETRGEVRSRGD